LNLLNTALATTGTYTAGNFSLDATIKGTAEAPLVAGTARIAGGRFNDAVNGIAFDRIDAELVAEGQHITIRSFTARTGDDGTVQASGTITLDPQAGFPGNVQITAQKARLINNEIVRLVADAKLALTGPLATTPKLSGSIDVRSMDVNIPDKLPGSLNATEVRHINVPNAEQPKLETPQTKTQQRKEAQQKAPPRAAAPFVAELDLTINAPNRVFVRGRGMEAELGGTMKVTGTSAKPITNGSFDLRHGRLDVIDRRLNFTRGKVAFRGSTDPELDFVAESRSADITARVLVTGQASAPKISFTSTPVLPEDEILARLLFGKPAGTLTPGQAIQVARAVAQFSGSGSNRRMDDLRRSLGISSLDIGTGENGSGGQVGIGKRLNDNVYLGVSQGTTTNSGQVSVDVDVMKNIKVQGKAGAAGGEVGIGAEWDY
jgi:translocation and assembly module TamB